MKLATATVPIGLLLLIGQVFGSFPAYKVEPARAEWTGRIRGTAAVRQALTCNFDGIAYCELFVGDYSPGTTVKAEMYEVGGKTDAVALSRSVAPARPHAWLRLPLTTTRGYSFTKGRQYEFRFTANTRDTVQFYYQAGDPYESGNLRLDAREYAGWDLCMRAHGVARVVEFQFGMNANLAWYNGDRDYPHRRTVLQSVRNSGVKWLRDHPASWHDVWRDSSTWTFATAESIVNACAADSINLIHLLCYGTSWAAACTNRVLRESLGSFYPPRNLYEPVFVRGAVNPGNYWATYVNAVATRFKGRITHYEVWNEPHCRIYWRYPDSHYGPVPSSRADSARKLCSLYVRLCDVATAVLKSVDPSNKVYVGCVAPYTTPGGRPYSSDWNTGVGWLLDFYDLGGRAPDGLSVHPYTRGPEFLEVDFAAYLDTTRRIMRTYGDGEKRIVCTEYGIHSKAGRGHLQADHAGKSAVLAAASQVDPLGPYDHLAWYNFMDHLHRGNDSFGLMTNRLLPKASYHAYRQTLAALRDKQVHGRAPSGEPALATHAHGYEFEDPVTGRRMWVAWRSDGREAEVALPCRVDSLTTTALAYGPSSDVRAVAAGADGWLRIRVGARPVFVSEPAAARISRPDVVVDSVRVTTPAPRAGERLDAVVYLRNTGNRPTPSGSPAVVTLSMDGDEVGRATVRSRVTNATTVTVSVRLPGTAAGSRLLSAVANPDARFVELDTDNNTAYLPVTILPRTR